MATESRTSTRSIIGTIGAVISLLVAGLLVAMSTSTAVTASDYFRFPSYAPAADISLQVDKISHELSFCAEPSMAAGLAFHERAMAHDLFSGDGFGLGRVDPRL